MPSRAITLRGVEVHNLKKVDLDLPYRQLIVFCGLSGSGKSSLALDTLYAEGQRRYIETFSAYTRQFLERLEKPAAERIDGMPPAIAVAGRTPTRSNRSTVGTATETNDYLRLLLAKIGRVFCLSCGREVRRDSPQSIAEWLEQLPAGTRYLVSYPAEIPAGADAATNGRGTARSGLPAGHCRRPHGERRRQRMGRGDRRGRSRADLRRRRPAHGRRHQPPAIARFARDGLSARATAGRSSILQPAVDSEALTAGVVYDLDGQPWRRIGWSTRLALRRLRAANTRLPEPRLFSFNSPLGACPQCEGFGNVIDIDMDLVVPDPTQVAARRGRSRRGTRRPTRTNWKSCWRLAGDYGCRSTCRSRADREQRRLIVEGVPERKFGGLRGFFAWLERRKYKMHIRVFLSRWRSYRTLSGVPGSAAASPRRWPRASAGRTSPRSAA